MHFLTAAEGKDECPFSGLVIVITGIHYSSYNL